MPQGLAEHFFFSWSFELKSCVRYETKEMIYHPPVFVKKRKKKAWGRSLDSKNIQDQVIMIFRQIKGQRYYCYIFCYQVEIARNLRSQKSFDVLIELFPVGGLIIYLTSMLFDMGFFCFSSFFSFLSFLNL